MSCVISGKTAIKRLNGKARNGISLFPFFFLFLSRAAHPIDGGERRCVKEKRYRKEALLRFRLSDKRQVDWGGVIK